MIGIVVVGYADFAEALIRAMQISKNKKVAGITAVSIEKSGDRAIIEGNRSAIFEAIAHTDQGSGVLVLTDSLEEDGGMIAASLVVETNIHVISGVNLPMLKEAVTHQPSQKLAAVAQKVLESARIAIVNQAAGPVS